MAMLNNQMVYIIDNNYIYIYSLLVSKTFDICSPRLWILFQVSFVFLSIRVNLKETSIFQGHKDEKNMVFLLFFSMN